MRILFGNPPVRPGAGAAEDAGIRIRQPGPWTSAILAALAGFILLTAAVAVSIAYSILVPESEAGGTIPKQAIPWVGMLISFILCIPAHELLHAVLYPDHGLSDSTLLFVGWKKLQFGVYFEGRIPRARWILMRLFPLLVLTILPLGVYLLAYRQLNFAWESYLMIVLLTNSLGSGGDLVAAIIVWLQVPAAGVLNFYRGRAYWSEPRSPVAAALLK
jgi:hypothetical protein